MIKIFEQTLHQRRYIDVETAHTNACTIMSHYGNANSKPILKKDHYTMCWQGCEKV
jgi:hypothetical protein